MKFDPKIDLYLEAATGASETPSHRGKSRFPLAGVSLGAQYRPPLGQSLQCWRPNPGFDIVKQANLHYQPKYSTCRSSSAGCPPEPRLALACRPEDSVLYISRKALISAWFEVLKPLRIFLTDLLWCHLCLAGFLVLFWHFSPFLVLWVPCGAADTKRSSTSHDGYLGPIWCLISCSAI